MKRTLVRLAVLVAVGLAAAIALDRGLVSWSARPPDAARPALPARPPPAPPPGAPPPATAAAPAHRPAGGEELVDLASVDASIRIDMRYASRSNFLHETLYPANRCLLRPGVAARLARVQQRLAEARLGLVVWDCYRPLSIQQRMWDYVQDPRYVADPKQGSKHNRGAAVDVSLVELLGGELDMGGEFDDFSERSHRDFKELTDLELRHRRILENAMGLEGFVPLPTEWWHFDDPEWRGYALLDVPLDPQEVRAAGGTGVAR
jgi:D-alanyl-D-alanine dipeptidase